MNAQNRSVGLLFNPSVYIAGGEALGLGLGAIFIAGFLGWLGNTHFDGVLDAHYSAHVTVWIFVFEGILDWLCMALVLLVLGRLISNTGFRTIDVLGTQALARWPTVFMALIMLPKPFQRFASDSVAQFQMGGIPSINPVKIMIILTVVLAALVLVCWMVTLMYQAFSVACNVKGGKAMGTFIGGILIAEIISKVCIAAVLHHTWIGQTTNAQTVSGSQATTSRTGQVASDYLSVEAGKFVDLLAAQDYVTVETKFNSAMKSAMPEATTREVWEGLIAKAGLFKKQLRTRPGDQLGYDIVFVTCQFEKQTLDLKIVYDSDRKVTGLWIVTPTGP